MLFRKEQIVIIIYFLALLLRQPLALEMVRKKHFSLFLYHFIHTGIPACNVQESDPD